MTGADRSLAHRYFEDLFNAGDLSVADEILDAEIAFAGPITPDGINGIESFKRFAQAWYRGFPDRHFDLVEEWIDGDRIATLFRITGTHRGEFLGQAATGNAIDVNVMNFFRVQGGKIIAIHAFFNPLELLQPLGLAPTRNALGLRP